MQIYSKKSSCGFKKVPAVLLWWKKDSCGFKKGCFLWKKVPAVLFLMERFTRFQKGSCGFIFGKIVRTVTRETKISGMRNRGNQKLLNKTSGTMKFINIVSSKIDRRRRKKSLFTVRNVFFYKETPSWHHQNRKISPCGAIISWWPSAPKKPREPREPKTAGTIDFSRKTAGTVPAVPAVSTG